MMEQKKRKDGAWTSSLRLRIDISTGA